MSLLTGLSAFPLTPLAQGRVDEGAFIGLIERLAGADVDSVTVLGSTGSYVYLSTKERARVTELAVRHAGGIPVFVGVGALRTSDVLDNVQAAEEAGAAGILLAPVTYQPLTDQEVFRLYRTVTESTGLPVIVYDNPGTTRFSFTDDLYAQVAELPGIVSVKIPAVPAGDAAERIAAVRSLLPEHVTIGVSGDATAVEGLIGGADAWYSVVGGLLPELALGIIRAVQEGRTGDALREAELLAPLWELFAEYGSLRVIAAVAELAGAVGPQCLPLPVCGLESPVRTRVAEVVRGLGMGR